MQEHRFESDFAKKLYIEASAIADLSRIKRRYISEKFIWKVWQKAYKARCGCTRYILMPEDFKK